MINDHWFQMSTEIPADRCTYIDCGQPRSEHTEMAGEESIQGIHWFVGLTRCNGCGNGWNHPAHYLSKAHKRTWGKWL